MKRDEWGYGTHRPALFFRPEGEDAELAAMLADMPCVVIAVATGSSAENWPHLASACDVIVKEMRHATLLLNHIQLYPLAALVLVQQLRLVERLNEGASQRDAVLAESLAYASLQQGAEFRQWQKNAPPLPPPATASDDMPIQLDHNKVTGCLHIILNRAGAHNAINVAMRDALCEALELARLDKDIQSVALKANGKCFSIGGAVEEFGTIADPATAHWIRTLRLPARFLLTLDKPVHVAVHGAVIGAGLEMAGFATRLTAHEKSWFQLPELKYGLIPGAGGTVSLPRRIGRHKTAWLALSMKKITAQTAYEWGLVDDIVASDEDK